MSGEKKSLQDMSLLIFLLLLAVFLTCRLVYLFLSDAQRFPITVIKISASYEHVSRKQIAELLNRYTKDSYFSLSVLKLKKELTALKWVDTVDVSRVWPDHLTIKLSEKEPVAYWNQYWMTEQGELLEKDETTPAMKLPYLKGPQYQQLELLQMYRKLSKLLTMYGLHATLLQLSDNQAWKLILENGIQIRLGKQDLEARLLRFCKAYPSVFRDKVDKVSSIDLRYDRGMAVHWKQ